MRVALATACLVALASTGCDRPTAVVPPTPSASAPVREPEASTELREWPEAFPLASVRMQMDREAGVHVAIDGTGALEYRLGDMGHRTATLSSEEVMDLLQAFKDAGFLCLPDRIVVGDVLGLAPDGMVRSQRIHQTEPDYTTLALSLGAREHRVRFVDGSQPRLDALREGFFELPGVKGWGPR